MLCMVLDWSICEPSCSSSQWGQYFAYYENAGHFKSYNREVRWLKLLKLLCNHLIIIYGQCLYKLLLDPWKAHVQMFWLHCAGFALLLCISFCKWYIMEWTLMKRWSFRMAIYSIPWNVMGISLGLRTQVHRTSLKNITPCRALVEFPAGLIVFPSLMTWTLCWVLLACIFGIWFSIFPDIGCQICCVCPLLGCISIRWVVVAGGG